MTVKKAFLFAAGLGERLRPLTQKNPKPLLPIGNRPIIDYSLAYLKQFGVEEVMINLHYFGEKIEKHVGDGKQFGLKIHFSKEETLLGTGGGLKKCGDFFKNEEAFLTLNSDTLINCDLQELAQFHQTSQLPVTLVVAPWQEGYTRLQVGNNKLLNIGDGNHLFTGLTVMTPKIFETLPAKPSNLILDGVFPLMNRVKGITTFEHLGFWYDIGTMESYQKAQEAWAGSHHNRLV